MKWTTENNIILRALYPKYDNAIVAEKLGCDVKAVRNRAAKLKLRKDEVQWTTRDEHWLLANYKNKSMNMRLIMAHFPDRTRWAIINKYRELAGLNKR
jgi:hypothetical protein